jgi:hypothetical protein
MVHAAPRYRAALFPHRARVRSFPWLCTNPVRGRSTTDPEQFTSRRDPGRCERNLDEAAKAMELNFGFVPKLAGGEPATDLVW